MEPGQPPRKRLKFTPSVQLDVIHNTERERKDRRLKGSFDAIFEKYGRDFTDVSDIVDLETGQVVIDNGHIKSMSNELDITSRIMGWPLQKLTVNSEEPVEDSEDELASPAIAVDARTPSDRIVMRQPRDEIKQAPSSGGRSTRGGVQAVRTDAQGLYNNRFPIQPNDLAKAFSNSFTSLAGPMSHQQRWNSIEMNAIQQFGQNFALQVAQLMAGRPPSHDYVEPAWRTPMSLHLEHMDNMQTQAIEPPQQQPAALLETEAYAKATGAHLSRVRCLSRSPERQSLWAVPEQNSSSTDNGAQEHARSVKPRFSSDEDDLLIALRRDRSLTWKKISDHFPGRPYHSVITRWNKHVKKIAPARHRRGVPGSHEDEVVLVKPKEHHGLSRTQIQPDPLKRKISNITKHYNLRTRATPGSTARKTAVSALANGICQSTNKSNPTGPSSEAPIKGKVPLVIVDSSQVQLDMTYKPKSADQIISSGGVVHAGSACQAPTECLKAKSNHNKVNIQQATPNARRIRKFRPASFAKERALISTKIGTKKINSSKASPIVANDTRKEIHSKVASNPPFSRKGQGTPWNSAQSTLPTPISIAAQRDTRVIGDVGPGILVEIPNSSDGNISGVETPRPAKKSSADTMSAVHVQNIDLLTTVDKELHKPSKVGKRRLSSLKSMSLPARTINQTNFSTKLAEDNIGSDDELAL